MQIVIDIDDNLYTRLFDNGDEYVADMRRACVAIRNGTPLHKGHGDLIDKSKIKAVELEDSLHNMQWTLGSETDLKVEAETIIEADKESEEV